jgi:hypothetical protein
MQTIWELDFYSRPLLDENKKKVWEVLVCETPTRIDTDPDCLFRYAEFCASTEVNSARLKAVLQEAIARAPKRPDRIRFFRQAMTNMITTACKDMGIPVQVSRRTLALNQWLQQRLEEVYPTMLGFQAGTNPTVSFAATPAQPLPDALLGQKWAFVSLEAGAFADMGEWAIDFGEAFPLSLVGLSPDTRIPGLIIFSSRSVPLSAWMSGLELAFLKADLDAPAQLLLETGISDRWILAPLNSDPLQAEAREFETAKQAAKGVHFLAVQASPEIEAFAGFWLLQETVLA